MPSTGYILYYYTVSYTYDCYNVRRFLSILLFPVSSLFMALRPTCYWVSLLRRLTALSMVVKVSFSLTNCIKRVSIWRRRTKDWSSSKMAVQLVVDGGGWVATILASSLLILRGIRSDAASDHSLCQRES